MVVIKTHQELVALDLGMQIILRHQLQVQLDEARERVVDLEAEVKALQETAQRN